MNRKLSSWLARTAVLGMVPLGCFPESVLVKAPQTDAISSPDLSSNAFSSGEYLHSKDALVTEKNYVSSIDAASLSDSQVLERDSLEQKLGDISTSFETITPKDLSSSFGEDSLLSDVYLKETVSPLTLDSNIGSTEASPEAASISPISDAGVFDQDTYSHTRETREREISTASPDTSTGGIDSIVQYIDSSNPEFSGEDVNSATDEKSLPEVLPDNEIDIIEIKEDITNCIDLDSDGYGTNCALGSDCDDYNPAVYQLIKCNYDGNSCGNYSLCVEECLTSPAEICDGIDNNCNGQTDEKVKKNSCGTCGSVPIEICDGIDNDCDGSTDENLTQTCYSICGNGLETCVNGVWKNCTAPQPLAEVCNGIDDNCDGQTDENVKKNSCGACGSVPIEICDGIDNDCDGGIDESLTQVCYSASGSGIEYCINGTWQNCDAPLSPPEVFDNFVSGLSSGDLEKTLDYFDPFVTDKYKAIFQSKDLNQVSKELSDVILILKWEGKRFAEYVLTKSCTSNIECPNQELCTKEQCEGEYPIIFIKTYKNGTETWKITAL